VRYHSYRFFLPKYWSRLVHEELGAFVLSLGENRYPPEIGVLQVRHASFFIDYPSFGFPYFKISFYLSCPQKIRLHYLRLLADQLHCADESYPDA